MPPLTYRGKTVATIGASQRGLVLAIETGKQPIDLSPLARTKVTSVIIKATENGDLPNAKLPATWPGLERLEVYGAITNWKVLRGYTDLETLDTGVFTEVSDTAWLAALPKLRTLTIDVTDTPSIAAIADLPALERLQLYGYKFDAAPLARATALRHLTLRVGKATKGLAALAALTGLESLAIEESGLKDLSLCEGMTKLCEIRIVGGLASAKGIAKLTALERVQLDRTSIADLRPLEKLRKLRVLSLRFSRNVKDLTPLAKLTQLRDLDLYEIRGGVKSLKPLAKLTNLDSLNFGLTAVTDGDFTPLHKLKKLRSLEGDVETPNQLAALREALPKCRPMFVDVNDEGDTEEIGSVVVSLPERRGEDFVIFQDLVDDLGVDDQDDVETMVSKEMKKVAPKLAKQITYDSEGSAFVASSKSEDAIMTLAKVIDAMIEGEDYDPDDDDDD